MDNVVEYKNYIIVGKRDDVKTILNVKTNEMFYFNDNIEMLKDEIDRTAIELVPNECCYICNAHNVKGLTIATAELCNMKCSYCYANEGTYNNCETTIINEKEFEKLVENIWLFNPSGVSSIHFFGGEPLLASKEIFNFCQRVLVEYKERNMEPPHFSITTNGTLLMPEMVKKMKEYDFAVCVSLDGPKEINDYARKLKDGSGSYEKIMNGLRFLQQEKINYAVEATVIHKQFIGGTKEQFYKYFEFFMNIGASLVGFFGDINDDVLTLNQTEELQTIVNFYNYMVDFYFEQLHKDVQTTVFSNVFSIIAKILGNRQSGICSAGLSQVFLNAKGEIYPCQTYYAARKSRMGNLEHMGEYLQEAENMQECLYHRMPEECKTCNYFRYCESKCPGSNLLVNGRENSIISLRCIISKTLVNRVIENMGKIGCDENSRRLFESNFLHAAKIIDSLNGNVHSI